MKTQVFHKRVLELAKKGWGQTHPNPMVGALIVENNKVVAEGFHQRAGGPHAEVETLKALGRNPDLSAVMFISLEPCSTHGLTPPCTDAILKSGIKNVEISCLDPNPLHSGRGLEILRKAGIYVRLASNEEQKKATELNFIFNHHMKTGRPLIALKIATTSNGMVSETAGKSSRVTEDEARVDMMMWRRLFPSICVGSGTVLADNPELTSRIEGQTFCPVRLIIDSSLSTLDTKHLLPKVFTDKYAELTYLITTAKGMENKERVKRAFQLNIRLLKVESETNGRVSSGGLISAVQNLGLNAVYCEGGPTLADGLLSNGKIDYLFQYISPKVFNGAEALAGPNLKRFPIQHPIEQNLGEDRLVHGFL